MNKKLITVILLAMLFLPLVLAIQTEITAKASPNDRLDIRVYTPNKEKLQELVGEFTNDSGELTLSHTSAYGLLYIITYEKNNDMTMNKFHNVSSKGDIYIDLTKNPPTIKTINIPKENLPTSNNGELAVNVEIVNDTNETLEVIPQTNEEITTEESNIGEVITPGLTGAVISESEGGLGFFKVFFYVLGIFFVIGILLLVLMKKGALNKPHNTNIRVKSIAEFNAGKLNATGAKKYNKKLLKAEIKLKKTQQKFHYLKNRGSKIEELKEKIKREQKELERLEKGHI